MELMAAQLLQSRHLQPPARTFSTSHPSILRLHFPRHIPCRIPLVGDSTPSRAFLQDCPVQQFGETAEFCPPEKPKRSSVQG